MERGRYGNQRPNSNASRGSTSGALVIQEPANAAANNTVNNPNNYPRHDPDLLMPLTNIVRIMRRIMPSNSKVSEEAKELMQECVSEYVSFITGEANERCHREHRKTITAEDILYAHSKLGFENYVGPLTLFLNRYRNATQPPMMIHAAPPHHHLQAPFNPAFQVGADQLQGFFNPALMMHNFCFTNAPGANYGGGADMGGSASNIEESAGAPFPPPGFYPGDHRQ